MVTVNQSESHAPPPTGPERRLAKVPFMLPAILALMWLSTAAESQTVLPLVGELAREYHLNPIQVAWSLSVTGIATAATVCGMSRLADLYGLRRLLLISLALVLVGNVVCTVAPGAPVFLLGRTLCGITAATPIFFALLRLRSKSTGHVDISSGTMTTVAGLGTGLSFLIGGLVLTGGGSARETMGTMALLSLIVLVLAWIFVPDSDVRAQSRVDYVGSGLLGLALVCFMIGVGEGNEVGWTSPFILTMLVAAVVLLIAWAVLELRISNPMIDLRLMAKGALWPTFLVGGIGAGLGSTNSFAVSELVQTPPKAGYGFGASVLVTGLFLVPVGAMIVVGGLFSPRIIGVLGLRKTAVIGSLLIALGLIWFAFNHDRPWQVVVMLLVLGLGYSTAKTASGAAYMRVARHGEGGMIAGIDNLVSLALLGIGPTVATAILQSSTTHGVPHAGNFTLLWVIFAAVAVVMAAMGLLFREPDATQELAPDAVRIR